MKTLVLFFLCITAVTFGNAQETNHKDYDEVSSKTPIIQELEKEWRTMYCVATDLKSIERIA